MVTEVALQAFQVSMVDAPLVTVLDWAFSEIVGAWLVGVFCAIDPPPQAMATIKMVNRKTNADMRRTDRIGTPR